MVEHVCRLVAQILIALAHRRNYHFDGLFTKFFGTSLNPAIQQLTGVRRITRYTSPFTDRSRELLQNVSTHASLHIAFNALRQLQLTIAPTCMMPNAMLWRSTHLQISASLQLNVKHQVHGARLTRRETSKQLAKQALAAHRSAHLTGIGNAAISLKTVNRCFCSCQKKRPGIQPEPYKMRF